MGGGKGEERGVCHYVEPSLSDLLDFREHFSPGGKEKPTTDRGAALSCPPPTRTQPHCSLVLGLYLLVYSSVRCLQRTVIFLLALRTVTFGVVIVF